MTLDQVQRMKPEQVREFIREVGIAWENNRLPPYEPMTILQVVQVHGTDISTAMARAFMAQPALREGKRVKGRHAS